MGIGPLQIALIIIVVLIIFGAGKLPKVMSDIGKGVNGFKKGLSGEDEDNQNTNKKDTKNSDTNKDE